MTKNRMIFLGLAAAFVLGAPAFADTLAVVDLGGSCPAPSVPPANAIAPMEGECSLEVFHDNTTRAFVQDDTPNAESVYRGSFLFNPNDLGNGASKFRQNSYSSMSLTPGGCATPAVRVPMHRFFLLFKNGVYSLQAMTKGNLCGDRALTSDGTAGGNRKIALNPFDTVKICFEVETGSGLTGRARVAVVAQAATCPASADAAPWFWRDVSNQNLAVDQARMGTVATNNFGAGESGELYYDDFQSFRTLSP